MALRYAGAAALLAFGAGILMSVAGGRFVNGAGNIMPMHAAGFHGLQALPLVALLLGWSSIPQDVARSWIHVAGTSWLLFCLGLIAQSLAGRPPLGAGAPLMLSIVGFLTWFAVLLFAMRARRTPAFVATT